MVCKSLIVSAFSSKSFMRLAVKIILIFIVYRKVLFLLVRNWSSAPGTDKKEFSMFCILLNLLENLSRFIKILPFF